MTSEDADRSGHKPPAQGDRKRHFRTGNGSSPSCGERMVRWPSTRGPIMSFRIKGLPAEQFEHLFAMSDEELAAHGAVRRIANDRQPGYPCRVSLTDSRQGDELVLVNYEHLPVESPYRMRFAIFVRKGDRTYGAVNQVPDQLRKRTLAVRGYDTDGMMTGCELIDGPELETAIGRLLAVTEARYLHVHFAAAGCYAACVERA